MVAKRRRERLMFGRALLRRCPRCGARHLFHHWMRMADHCPGCGYRFERQEGFWFGAFVLNLCTTFALLLAVFFWLIVRQNANPDASIAPPLGVGLFVALVFPALFYPLSKTLWAAIDLITSPLELREIVDAVDAVEAAIDPGTDPAGDPTDPHLHRPG